MKLAAIVLALSTLAIATPLDQLLEKRRLCKGNVGDPCVGSSIRFRDMCCDDLICFPTGDGKGQVSSFGVQPMFSRI